MRLPLVIEAVEHQDNDAEVLAALKPYVTKGEPIVVVCISLWKDPPIAKHMRVGARVHLWHARGLESVEGTIADFVQLALEAHKDLGRSVAEAPPKARQS